INVASVAGLIGSPFLSPYGAAKAGLISLTKTLAVGGGAQGVPGNALCPGRTATGPHRHLWEGDTAGEGHPGPAPQGGLGRGRGDDRPGRLPGQRRLLLHDRPGPGRGRGPDRPRLTATNGKGPALTRRPLVSDGGYSVHHSSSFDLAALAGTGCLGAPPAGAWLAAGAAWAWVGWPWPWLGAAWAGAAA